MPLVTVPMPNGVSPDAAAVTAIPKDKGYVVENLLAHSPGKLIVRGPVGDPIDLYGAETGAHCGVWVHGETLLACASGSTTAKFFGGSSASDVALTSGASRMHQSKRSVRIGSYAYAPSEDDATALLRWNGTATEPTALTHAPRGSADVAAYIGRLFVAGGTAPGTASPAKPSSVWWTDIAGPTTNTLADWQDNVSGLTNEIIVGDDGDVIVGLAALPNQLLVFKRNSIWTILGSTPSTFTVRKLVSTLGAQSAQQILAVDDACLFVSRPSYHPYRFDGVELVRIASRSVVTGDIVRLPGNYVLWGSNLHYLPNGAWSSITYGATVVSGIFRQVMTEQGTPYLIDGRYIRSLDQLTSTEGFSHERNRANSADVLIPARIVTRALLLASPIARATIRRILGTHFLFDGRAGAADTPSWTLSLLDFAMSPVATYTLPASNVGQLIQVEIEANVEARSVLMQIALATSGAGPLAQAWLEDFYIEYAPSHQNGPG